MIYVVTAIMGGWDNLRAPAIANTYGARFICFTDNPVQPRVDPWEFRPLPAAPNLAPCRLVRLPKILPHLLLPEDAEYSIWHDANLQIKSEPTEIIAHTLRPDRDWAAHRHPARDCIYTEADELLRSRIGTAALVDREIARYRDEYRYPSANGLWANGFLVRRHTHGVARLNECWWDHYAAGCERDQISFPVARTVWDVKVATIEANVYDSPFLNFYFHAAWKDDVENAKYRAERERIRCRLDYLAKATGVSVPYSAD
jgi:hypothetical protein